MTGHTINSANSEKPKGNNRMILEKGQGLVYA